MLPPALFALRDQMYAAHAVYIRAQRGYFIALDDQRPPDVQAAHVQQCRTTAAPLDDALAALLAYLDHMDPTPERAAERDRTQQIQTTLHRELTLLPQDG